MSSGAWWQYPKDVKPNCLSIIIALVCHECRQLQGKYMWQVNKILDEGHRAEVVFHVA